MKIHLHNIEIPVYTGIYNWEKKVKQGLILNVEILLKDKIIQNINDTVDYDKIYNLIITSSKQKHFDLLEQLVETLISKILNTFFSIKYCKITAQKQTMFLSKFKVSVEMDQYNNNAN